MSQCENLKAMKAFLQSKTDVEKTSSSDFNLVKFKDKALALIVECSNLSLQRQCVKVLRIRNEGQSFIGDTWMTP